MVQLGLVMDEKSLLIMEDAGHIRRLIIDMLSDIHEITTFLQAEDAASAAKIIKEDQPAIAILDINVPGSAGLSNGIDVLKLAKALYPQMIVIMLTNHANERYRLACKQAGADYFFDKSTEFDLLPITVKAVQKLTDLPPIG